MKMLKVIGITTAIVAGTAVFVFALGKWGGFVIKNPFPQTPDISLSLSESGDKLVVSGESGNRGKCAPPAKPGCVGVSKWRRASIKFWLVNMNGWSFEQIQLVAEPLPKLNFGTQTPALVPEMIDDFYVRINGNKIHPDKDGIIKLAELEEGKALKLVNRNNFTQTYSYQIQACIDPTNCVKMDPRIKNEGRQ